MSAFPAVAVRVGAVPPSAQSIVIELWKVTLLLPVPSCFNLVVKAWPEAQFANIRLLFPPRVTLCLFAKSILKVMVAPSAATFPACLVPA